MLGQKKDEIDEDDILNNIIDDITNDNGLDEFGGGNNRPATTGNFNNRKESLWSAAGPRNQTNNLGTGSKYGGNDLDDDLDDLEDDDEDAFGSGLNKQFSANKASSH